MKEIVNDGFAKVVKPYIDAQDKKSREIIAPVEVSPAEAAHSIGDQIVFDGILYDVIAPIAVDDPLTATGAGANIKLADDISAQIKAQKAEIQTVGAQAAANNKSTQEMIAPVEEDETDASRAYEIGEQLILGGILYDVIDDIAQHGIITAEGAGANIEKADTIAEQIKNKTITTDAVPTQGSTNPVQSNGVYVDNRNIYEVMGQMGAKNLIPFPYYNDSPHTTNGITFTVNPDGSVTASGTASSDAYFRCTYTSGDKHIALLADTDYILSGTGIASVAVLLRNSGGSNVASARATDVTYSCTSAGNYDIILLVENGTDLTTPLTIYPMLRYASDTDSTYQPYVKTNKELTAENEALTNKLDDEVETRATLGAHNLLPNKAVSKTENGVTFTVNDDGSITINGTATSNTWVFLIGGTDYPYLVKQGKYTISTGSVLSEGVSLLVKESVSDSNLMYVNSGEENGTFTISNDTYTRAGIRVANGTTVSNLTVYPMIRLASDIDDTYQPYAMTNREMTPYVQAISNPNLLDNPWFTVNQRNKTSSSTGGYTVDRWTARNTTEISISDNIVTLVNNRSDGASWFGQQFELDKFTRLIGKTLTYSFMLSTGEIKSWTFTLTSNTLQSSDFALDNATVNLRMEWGQDKFGVLIWLKNLNDTVSIKAVKLELGSVSTLAMDTAPNYATELLKCQRYFVRVGNPNGNAQVGISQAINASELSSIIPISVPMRTNPTLTTDYTKVFARNGNTKTAITSVGNISVGGCNAIWCSFNGAFTTGTFYEIRLESIVFDFSADL